jgi:hypothetical protein
MYGLKPVPFKLKPGLGRKLLKLLLVKPNHWPIARILSRGRPVSTEEKDDWPGSPARMLSGGGCGRGMRGRRQNWASKQLNTGRLPSGSNHDNLITSG